ncbi:MAG: hypothetical protein KF902_02100 [Phycisphaeraceae bacterium]|nr:hypothetical protein [Phycisphaeraceae bacterium]
MPGESVNKVCCKCGVDVSQAKRHKDAKGRYWCEPCFAKAAAEAKQAGGAAKADKSTPAAATPAWLAGSLAVEGKRCTACSAPMPKEGVICTTCGHNSETGKAMGTRVVMAPKEKEPRVKRAGIDPTMWAYLYAVVCIGLLIAGTSNSACALTFIIIANLGGFVVWVWTLVAMGMQSIVKAVIGGLCWVYMLYWLIAVCDNSLLKTWFGITLLMALLVVLAQVGIIPLEGLEELGLGKPSTLLEGVPDTERAYRVS